MNTSEKRFDLEERFLQFARLVAMYVNNTPKSIVNNEYCRQIVRSSSSIGANYMEAREAASGKDFVHKIKLAKKEARETRYWLQLLIPGPIQTKDRDILLQESLEILKILSVICAKVQAKETASKS